MNTPCPDLDIGRITIVARKTASEAVRFACPAATHDGFIYFEKGKGSFLTDSGTYQVEDGALFLLFRGDAYRLSVEAGSACIVAALALTPADTARTSLPSYIPQVDPSLAATLKRLAREWEVRRPGSYMRCKILLLSLYTDLLTADGEGGDPTVRRMLEFIHTNFRRPFAGEELAEACGLSLSYLRHCFREAMGMSVTEYRDSLRIAAACEMLRSSLYSPKEVARALGYSDVHHFTKVFALRMGIPPARYAEEATV